MSLSQAIFDQFSKLFFLLKACDFSSAFLVDAQNFLAQKRKKQGPGVFYKYVVILQISCPRHCKIDFKEEAISVGHPVHAFLWKNIYFSIICRGGERCKKVGAVGSTTYRVSHRYCFLFEVNFTMSGTRYLQKNNRFVKFEKLSFNTMWEIY